MRCRNCLHRREVIPYTVKPVLSCHSKRQNTVKPVLNGHTEKDHQLVFKANCRLNAGQKYRRMLHGEHSAIRSTFIKLQFVKYFLSFFEWPLKTGFTVQ